MFEALFKLFNGASYAETEIKRMNLVAELCDKGNHRFTKWGAIDVNGLAQRRTCHHCGLAQARLADSGKEE